MAKAQPLPEPTQDEAIALFKAIEAKFPSDTLGDDKWYLITIAALCGGSKPDFAPALYGHLIAQPSYATPESRQALMRRLREALVKLVPLIGVCKCLEAIFDIDAITRPEDKDYSFSREGWQCDEANLERGAAWQNRIYLHNMGKIDETFSSQRDFDWVSKNITYGLFLSDHTILTDVETELVVLAGIMIQNLPRETHWHLRGTRRIGVSNPDTEVVQQCIEMVAEFCGVCLNKIPRVADVEHEV